MSFELCVLASGSGGNCTVLRTPGGVLMVDAGIGPGTAARRLQGTGVALGVVSAVCLTHLDGDHFNANWVGTFVRRGVRVYCHAGRVGDLLRRVAGTEGSEGLVEDFAALVRPFDESALFEPLPGLSVRAVPLAHDSAGSHGFVFDGFSCRVGYASDLGHVPARLLECFCDLDVLALESNYDTQMELASARPAFLKRRIMGGRGHLSNQQAFEAVRQIFDRCQRNGHRLPAHVVLLHRSRQCNCPELLRRLFGRDARVAGRLTLAEQHHRTAWLGAGDRSTIRGEQLMLAWG
jgi:phosphoribosyl 1,2-cyclic phosphodiesterase